MRLPNKIGGFKQTQGTETSKYLEERTSTETPLVVASERGPGQWPEGKNGKDLERSAIVGDSPVSERAPCVKLSRAGHEKPCLNMGGPSSKAKYS